ncbi:MULTISPECIES: Mu transposase C-terminal domain-containing protein [unclassified Microbacterium]|uniref:Mu transposase C-terminal domain-containing protein n=1 Tax=unclassified Microbacterium TaxID=2609290 RepID=UPI00160514EE|nr:MULTISPECIES: Mu transposase C-terminal domain-containing protein [unclassified Microbacterium]QNA91479.1 transposase [Microbacterium sp. Se63.02b]QYM64652.1 DDE-type integrase/transposase/recombinase [Microbacterium sp. Se5.02b]
MSDERKLKLGDSFEIDGESWVWVHIIPGLEVKLRSEHAPDRHLIMSVDEFLLQAGTAQRDRSVSLRPDGDAWPTDVCDMEAHLLEAFTGRPMDPLASASRAQYDPALTTQNARVDAKLLELKGTSLGRARSTFHLLWKTYQQDGAAGLNARMHRKGEQRLSISRADARLVTIIDRFLDRQTDKSTSSKRRCAVLVRRELETTYPGDPLCEIKARTLQGYINERAAGRYSFDKATTRRNTDNSPKRQYYSGAAYQLGERCEIDSTKLDVLVWDENSEFRPTLTVLLDVASRVPLAWAIHADSPGGFDHALLLARAVIGRKAVPGSGAATLAGSATLPSDLMKQVNPYLTDDSLALPWIFPRSITIDGGADFRSRTFRDACSAYGIHRELAPSRTPTVKPHVERNFGTLSTDFAAWLAGFVGNSVAHRAAKDDPTLTLDSLRLILDSWITNIYLNRPHRGLKSTSSPGRIFTPNQMYTELFAVGPGVPVPFGVEEYLALLPTERRMIGRAGIELHNRRYDSPHLEDLRNRSLTGAEPGSAKARKFPVSFDPYNANAVWVRHPETGVWIECWDIALREKTAPMVAEIDMKLLARYPDAAIDDPDRRREWIDHVESRERGDKRKRTQHKREQQRLKVEAQREPGPSTTTPIPLRQWAKPVDITSIDWTSPDIHLAQAEELDS